MAEGEELGALGESQNQSRFIRLLDIKWGAERKEQTLHDILCVKRWVIHEQLGGEAQNGRKGDGRGCGNRNVAHLGKGTICGSLKLPKTGSAI